MALTNEQKAKIVTAGGLAHYHEKSGALFATKTAVSGKADKVSSATNNNLAGLNSNGNLKDSGIAAADVMTKTINTTWSALKTLRDNSGLIAGQWYRITDYTCTTTQTDTQSAGHVFDIIVRADSTDTLNENAYAAKHAGDTYFANSNLTAWELKYTIDNIYWSLVPTEYITLSYQGQPVKALYDGTENINGTTYLRWVAPVYVGPNKFVYSTSNSVGEALYYYYNGSIGQISSIDSYGKNDEQGKGTIVWMKDEYNNECPYDFKNIQFEVGAKEKAGTVANVFYYTFSVASGTNDATVTDHSLNGFYCYNNRIGKWITDLTQKLNFNVFRNTSTTALCYSNTFGNSCFSNTFGNYCYSNTFGNRCNYNTFGNRCYSNTFGDDCFSNTFGNNCYSNTFGNSCNYNTFGNNCYSNKFLKNYSYYIIIENGNRYISITSTQTTSSSNKLQNFTIAQGVNNTTTNKTISHDTVNDTFQTIYKPVNSVEISV